MSLILNIDTATATACVSIARNGHLLAVASNTAQKEQGGFLQPAIHTLLKDAALQIQELDAIAVSAGPGSYTGLRIGMAGAKGLCYALGKPLITLSTLEIMALGAIATDTSQPFTGPVLFCPMLDARRMEVYTALYDRSLQAILPPCAVVLDKNSFANSLLNNRILFFGNGAEKWASLCSHENVVFIPVSGNPLAMSKLAFQKYRSADFADLAYSEPFYLKEFTGS